MGIISILFTEELRSACVEVEREMKEQASIFSGKNREMFEYAVEGGMRFRPMLVYLGSYLLGGSSKTLAPAAAALELLHKASLVHDDLIDGDAFRRGRPSFHTRFGDREAVLMGDLLVAAAFKKLQQLRETAHPDAFFQVNDLILHLYFTLSRGVLRELEGEGSYDDREEIEGIMYEKTAVFLETCLCCGALLGNNEARAEELQALARLGKNLGLVFQILNDVKVRTTTLRQLLVKVRAACGSDAIVELNHELVVGLYCEKCQAETPCCRPLNKVAKEEGLCPDCGEMRIPAITHRLLGDEHFLDETLAAAGLPPWDIVRGRCGLEQTYFELAGDRPLEPSPDGENAAIPGEVSD